MHECRLVDVYIRTTSHLHLPVAAVSSQSAAGTSDDANDAILSQKVYSELVIVTWEECEGEKSCFTLQIIQNILCS